MRKLFLLLLALTSFSAATTLTGSFKYPNTTGVNGILYMRVSSQGTVSSAGSCGGPYQVVPTTEVPFKIVNGAMPGGASVVGTDCILPVGIQYVVRLIDNQGNQLFQDNWTITGSTVDVGVVADSLPVAPTAVLTGVVLTNPPAGQTINQPSGTSLLIQTGFLQIGNNDVGFSRLSPGILGLGNGTSGSSTGGLYLGIMGVGGNNRGTELIDIPNAGVNQGLRIGTYFHVGHMSFTNAPYMSFNARLTTSDIGSSTNKFTPDFNDNTSRSMGVLFADAANGSLHYKTFVYNNGNEVNLNSFIELLTINASTGNLSITSSAAFNINGDTGISRDSAGIFDFGNGTAGSKTAGLNAGSGNFIVSASGDTTVNSMKLLNVTGSTQCLQVNTTGNISGTGSACGAGGGGTGVTSIAGTTNQIIASAATGAITLSTPQDINTTSSPQFANVQIPNAGSLRLKDTSGANGLLAPQGDNNLVFYSTDAGGAQRAIWNVIMHNSSSPFTLDVNTNLLPSVALQFNLDSGLSRLGAVGVLGIGNGNQGDASGTFKAKLIGIDGAATLNNQGITRGLLIHTPGVNGNPANDFTQLLGDDVTNGGGLKIIQSAFYTALGSSVFQTNLMHLSTDTLNHPKIDLGDVNQGAAVNALSTSATYCLNGDVCLSRATGGTFNVGSSSAAGDITGNVQAAIFRVGTGNSALALLGGDSNGSLEIGPSNSGGSTRTPFIDFHWHDTTTLQDGQDLNMRLINSANSRLDVVGNGAGILRIADSAGGLQFASDTGLSRSIAARVAVGNGTPGDVSGSLVANRLFATNNSTSDTDIASNYIHLGSGHVLGFQDNTLGSGGTTDVAFSRNGAAALNLGNGTAGDITGQLNFRIANVLAGSNSIYITPTAIRTGSGSVIGFTSTTQGGNTSQDTGISRLSAGVMAFGNGSVSDSSGTIKLAGIQGDASANLSLKPTASLFVDIVPTTSGTGLRIFEPTYTTASITLTNLSLSLISGVPITWNGDLGLSREAAGILDVGNSIQGNTSGWIKASNVITTSATITNLNATTSTLATINGNLTLTGTVTGPSVFSIDGSGNINVASCGGCGSGTFSGKMVGWNSSGNLGTASGSGTLDTAFTRSSAGWADLGNGSLNNTSGTLRLNQVLIRTGQSQVPAAMSCTSTSLCTDYGVIPILASGVLVSNSSGTLTVTNLPYTGASKYNCVANDNGGSASVQVTNVSGTNVTFQLSVAATRFISFQCIGF